MINSDDTPAMSEGDMEEYLAAYAEYEQGSYALAHSRLTSFVLEYPDHLPLNQLFVSCLMQLGHNYAANKHIKKIYQAHPTNTDIMLLMAQTCTAIGERGEYRKILRDIIALARDDRPSLLADAYLKEVLGLYQEAYSAYVRLLGDPMQINYGLDFGSSTLEDAVFRDQNFIPLLVRLRRINDAQILVDKSLMLFPDSKYVLINAALVAKAKKDYRVARSYLLRAKAVAPTDTYILGCLVTMSLCCFRFKDAFRYFLDFFRIAMKGELAK